jgi:carboxylesterase
MSERIGALLIHGLGGTQYDLGSMHRQLKRCGVETHALTLPGHGTTPEDLVPVRAEAWIDAVTSQYRELVQQYDVLHVMGMCMGALLAATLCARERHQKGRLVMLAPPIFIDGWSTPWWRAARHVAYYLPLLPGKMKVEEGEPYGIKNQLVRNIVKAKFARGDNFHYAWVPLACIREVDRLRRRVMRDMPQVPCPTLVVHAREDELTSLKSAEFVARTAQNVHVIVLENSYHMICVDNDREQVAAGVQDFLGVEPRASEAPAVITPCTPDEIRSITERFMSGMREQRYEEVFPLFSSDVRWEHQGANPLARIYDNRNALIDLFSQFVALSAGTFRVTAFGEPELGADSARVRLFSEARAAGTRLVTSGQLDLRFGNGRIRAVRYEPEQRVNEDSFWTAAAHAHRTASPVPVGGGPVAIGAALAGDALQAAFERAVAEVGAITRPLAPIVMLRLRALYKQARSGDVTGARPGMTDVVGRAKYDSWAALRGTARDDAMNQYVALARSLAGE